MFGDRRRRRALLRQAARLEREANAPSRILAGGLYALIAVVSALAGVADTADLAAETARTARDRDAALRARARVLREEAAHL